VHVCVVCCHVYWVADGQGPMSCILHHMMPAGRRAFLENWTDIDHALAHKGVDNGHIQNSFVAARHQVAKEFHTSQREDVLL